MWKGSISFGLVNIPVKMYAATEEKNIRFRYLHQKCKNPIQSVRTCPHCEQEVPWNEVVKGYEYADGKFVVMEKEELENLFPDANKAIEILDFVDLKEIDPIYFQKSYYLGGQDANHKAYALLREALRRTGKIGIAKITIRSKQTLGVLRVVDNCLVLESIFYPDEIRDSAQVPYVPEGEDLPQKELEMAEKLIENLTTQFDPSKYKDEYREKVQEAVEQKIHGQEVVVSPSPKPDKVVDLMAALQASLEATKPKKKTRRKKQASS
jgi:DNA end-binding protein Ku